jgi:uncharacterized protein (DUF2267 family)
MQSLTEQLRQIIHAVRERLMMADAEAVAAALDISKSNIYRMRAGGTPSLQTLELLAYYFDTGCRLEDSPNVQADLGPAKPPPIYPTETPR